ncbi:MAG: helix-turn-helix domain-containing protein [Fluviibacter sp.]
MDVQNPTLLDDPQAAEFIGVSPQTLPIWRCTGRYSIPYIKVGRKVRYRPEDLLAWLESRRVSSGSETA